MPNTVIEKLFFQNNNEEQFGRDVRHGQLVAASISTLEPFRKCSVASNDTKSI